MTQEIPKSQAGDLPDKDGVLVPRNFHQGSSHHLGQVLIEADHQSLHPLAGLGNKVELGSCGVKRVWGKTGHFVTFQSILLIINGRETVMKSVIG